MNRQAEKKETIKPCAYKHDYKRTDAHMHVNVSSVFSVSSLSPRIHWIGPLSLTCHRSEHSWIVRFLSVWQPPPYFICRISNNLECFLNKSSSECVWCFITHSGLHHNPMFSWCSIFKVHRAKSGTRSDSTCSCCLHPEVHFAHLFDFLALRRWREGEAQRVGSSMETKQVEVLVSVVIKLMKSCTTKHRVSSQFNSIIYDNHKMQAMLRVWGCEKFAQLTRKILKLENPVSD